MNKKQIDRFFRVLDRTIRAECGLKQKIKVILTGAAAGVLLGGNRPSMDIDFAISADKRHLDRIEEAIKKSSDITGIPANFSEDIDRWSQITFLDYKKHIIPYKSFGVAEVFILSPLYWSIGKVTRYLDPDVDDLVTVLKNNSVSALELAKLWGKALRKSPRSAASFLFRTHVGHFFKTYGIVIWGKKFDQNKCLQAFYSSSGANLFSKNILDKNNNIY